MWDSQRSRAGNACVVAAVLHLAMCRAHVRELLAAIDDEGTLEVVPLDDSNDDDNAVRHTCHKLCILLCCSMMQAITHCCATRSALVGLAA